MTARALVVVAVVGVASGARAGEPPALAAAQRAVHELRYEDASVDLEAVLKRGHFARKELVAILALYAEVECIVRGQAAGESEFRRLLSLEPEHAPPRNTPIFTVPFARAQRWVAAHGRLGAEHKLAAAPRAGVPTPLAITVANDGLELVAGARLWVRAGGEAAFTAQPVGSLRPSLPPLRPGDAVDYYLEVVDAGENVLVEIGNADDSFTLTAPAAAPRPAAPRPAASAPATPPVAAPALVATAAPRARHPYRTGGGVMAALGLGALGAAIGVDVAGKNKLDRLLSTCAPSCAQSDAAALRTSESAAIALYVFGGAALTTSLVLFAVDLASTRRR